MKRLALIAILGFSGAVQAQTIYQDVGNTTFGSDGSIHQHVGNTTFSSDGSIHQRVGNTTFSSPGTTSYQPTRRY